jgi:hypothetical protein
MVRALPNPSSSYFTIVTQSNRAERIVIDLWGRIIEMRNASSIDEEQGQE